MRLVFHCPHNNQSLWRTTLIHLIPLFTRQCTAKASLHKFPLFFTSPHNNQSLWTVENDFHTLHPFVYNLDNELLKPVHINPSLLFTSIRQNWYCKTHTHTQLTCSTQSSSTSLFIRNHTHIHTQYTLDLLKELINWWVFSIEINNLTRARRKCAMSANAKVVWVLDVFY